MIKLFHLARSFASYYVALCFVEKIGNPMKKFLRSLTCYVTICTVLALTLVVGAVANGSNQHGSMPPPDDGTGTIAQHGSMPPPDDGTGTIRQHGSMPPPDDGTGTIVG
jgi:hypothetical protein